MARKARTTRTQKLISMLMRISWYWYTSYFSFFDISITTFSHFSVCPFHRTPEQKGLRTFIASSDGKLCEIKFLCVHLIEFNAAPGLPRFTLICTLRTLYTDWVTPPENICNFIFFDSLYTISNVTYKNGVTNQRLQAFFQESAKSTATRFGLSIHIR